MRHARQLADQPIAALAFAAAGAPARGLAERLAERRGAGEAPGGEGRLALYVAAADCSLTVLEAGSGEPLGRDAWLRPRTADSAVALLALDAAGEPLPPPAAPLPLPWARGSPGARALAGRPLHECHRCRRPRPGVMQRPLFGQSPGVKASSLCADVAGPPRADDAAAGAEAAALADGAGDSPPGPAGAPAGPAAALAAGAFAARTHSGPLPPVQPALPASPSLPQPAGGARRKPARSRRCAPPRPCAPPGALLRAGAHARMGGRAGAPPAARVRGVSLGDEDEGELLAAAVAAAEAQAPARTRKGFGLLMGRAKRAGEPAADNGAPAASPRLPAVRARPGPRALSEPRACMHRRAGRPPARRSPQRCAGCAGGHGPLGASGL